MNTPTSDKSADAFELWWLQHGQFCRAGGGDYEKSFAWLAWKAAGSPDPVVQPESESLRALLASARFSHTSAEGVPVLVIYATEARLQEVLR